MKQPGLIYRVISYMVLGYGVDKVKYTPTGSVPLVHNEDVIPSSDSFNYISVVGIMLYLTVHTRTYIAFVVNCCARCTFCPKHLHGEDFKIIGWYLKLTWDRGLILNPKMELFKIDGYPDADLSGM